LISFDFGDSISSIAMSWSRSMAFTKSGNIFVWGSNDCGELGIIYNSCEDKPHLLDSSFSPKIFKPFRNSENFTNFLLHLLDSGEFSDVTISGKPLHKCIIHARSPKFLSVDLSSFEKSVVISVIHFLYSNSTELFSDLNPHEICSLILLSRSLEIPGLLSIAQKLLVDSLTTENAFHVLLQSDLGLLEEIEWILWFIRKNRIFPVGSLQKLTAVSPTITARAFQAVHLSLPPPNILTEPLPSIAEDLENLLISGEFSDFPLSVGGIVLPLHKCILSSWQYSRILFYDRLHTLQMPLETFKKILLFVYSGKLDKISFMDAGYIFALSPFYLLEDTELFHHCESMVSSVDYTNWMEAYALGSQLGDEELKRQAISCMPSSSPSIDTIKIIEALCNDNKALKEEVERLKGSQTN